MSPRTLGASIPSSSSCETNINGSVVTCVVNNKDAKFLCSKGCRRWYFRWGRYFLEFLEKVGGIPNTIEKNDLLSLIAFALPK